MGDPTVEVPLDVDPVLEAVERDADPDVRGHVVLREHPDVSGRRDRAEPEFAIVREVVARSDVREAVLERSRDVSGLQEGLESGPTADLALVAVGGDDAFRLDVHLLLEALRVDPADPAVVFQDGRRRRLEPDFRAGLGCLLGHGLVERIPFQDDADLVPGVGFLDRQLRAVRGEDLGTLDLAADPFLVERHLRVFDEVAGQSFATAHGGTDFLAFLDQEGLAAAGRRPSTESTSRPRQKPVLCSVRVYVNGP